MVVGKRLGNSGRLTAGGSVRDLTDTYSSLLYPQSINQEVNVSRTFRHQRTKHRRLRVSRELQYEHPFYFN